MAYCDTNILTAFNNKYNLKKFGKNAVKTFGGEIKGNRYEKGERK